MSEDKEFVPLLSVVVAGLTKGDMAKDLGALEDGPVELKRAPTNPHDPNAIRVIWRTAAGPKKVGYVPAIFCPMLINLRAAGYDIKSTITTRHLPHNVGLHFTIEKKS